MQKRSFTDGYKFKGYKAFKTTIKHPNDPESIIIKLKRIQKKLTVFYVVLAIVVFMTGKQYWQEIFPVEI